MSDSKTAEQLAGEVKGVLDARFGEVKSSLEAKQAELRGVLDARHNEIKSDLEGKHDKVKALAEEALGKAQRGEDLSNATKELADEARRFKKARVVISYYDHPLVRKLYKGWTFVDCAMTKGLHNSGRRGATSSVAPEILIMNGPSLGGGG